MTEKELYNLAERFYLGKASTFEVIATLPEEYIETFKYMLRRCMYNTAEALCKEVDNAKIMIKKSPG